MKLVATILLLAVLGVTSDAKNIRASKLCKITLLFV
jgi:hypothetical protein